MVLIGTILWQGKASAIETEPANDKQKAYHIMFQGNEALSEATLRKAAVDELKSFDQHGQRRSDVDDAAFQMEITYRKAGHAFAAVDYQIEQVEGKTLVTFVINEGPRVILKKIEITGNAAFKADELLRFFEGEKSGFFGQGKLLFIKSDIQSASSQILDFYIIQGYRDVLVHEPRVSFSHDQTEATVTIHIEEGIRYTLHDIYFLGDVIADAKDSVKNLQNISSSGLIN